MPVMFTSTIKSTLIALAGAACVFGEARIAGAQSVDTSLYAPLTLAPAPSETRLASGAPGPKYWQNRADYDLKATLDTATHTVRGTLVMRYTNNSPHALDVLWVQTEQDPDEPISRFTQQVNGAFVPVTLENHVTETKVTLAEPIKPGATAMFQVAWQFVVLSDKGQGRMGEDKALYEIAQWYPRVNVYDDVKGWNTEPYTTGAEFFLEYGDYTMEVTVPAGYIVAGTGTLDNPADVLTPTEIARLAAAAKSDTVVRVVTAAELHSGAARPKSDGTLTWKFHAKNVRDAVWCTAPDYQWDAIAWNGILAQAYYRPTAPLWVEGADMARMSIQEYSERWFPYPYPQISVVEGPVGGMEYPMLSMVSRNDSAMGLYDVITHEVGHNWFPMIVGSNERVHTWMDEGFNQFINTFSNARRYPQGGDQNTWAIQTVGWLEGRMQGHQSGPLETGQVIGNDGEQYFKTVVGLQILRRDIMGPTAFDSGMHSYIHRWAYRHPTPMDFFRTMNEATGRNLDWFWREWFLEATPFDQAIDSVTQTTQGNTTKVTVTYGNKTRGVLPLLVRFTLSDMSTQEFTYPADVWKANATVYSASYTFPGKTVTRIELDPGQQLVDVNRSNNVWVAH